MAIVPRKPPEGPLQFNHTWMEGYAKPSHLPVLEPTPLDPRMFPLDPVDTTGLDHEFAPPEPGGIAEDLSAVSGLFAAIAKRRLANIETKIQEQAHREEILRHVGEGIIRGETYTTVSDPLRPATVGEKHAAKRLDLIMRKRRKEHAHGHNVWMPLDPKLSTKTLGADGEVLQGHGLVDLPANYGLGDRYRTANNRRFFKKINKETEHLDHRFGDIIKKPGQKAKALREDHAKIVARLERKADKQAMKKMGDIVGRSWTDGDQGFQATSKNPDGTLNIVTFDQYGPVETHAHPPRHVKKFMIDPYGHS